MVDKSEKFNWLVRTGYLSRAILYAVLGLIALTSIGQIQQGTQGIFQTILTAPAGQFVLWIMVAGLTAYALFRFASLFFDIENQGSDKTGWAKRLGHGGSAIGHLALAYAAYKYASSGSSSGDGAQEVAAGVLSWEMGGVLIAALGIAFLIAAVFQAKKGLTGEFMQRISQRAPSQTRLLGGLGYGARAIVFAVIAWSLIQAGFLSGGSGEVKTLGDAVASLSDDGMIFTVVAIGLLIFGLFSLILARYRIIPDMGSSGKAPAFRA